MAHEIYESDNLTYTGAPPWHGIGIDLGPNESFDIWCQKAFPWTYLETKVAVGIDGQPKLAENFKGIVRSDTQEVLNIVTQKFNVVQPQDVMEFFRDMIDADQFAFETAGSLKNGRRVWALAKYKGDPIVIMGQDIIKPYVLLATSVDGGFATTAQFTSVRVVCNNTLSMSLRDDGATAIKVPHIATFDANAVKAQLGLIEVADGTFAETVNALANYKITDAEAVKFFYETVGNPAKKLEDQPRAFGKIVDLFAHGAGSNLRSASHTLWGAVNAVTNYTDHVAAERSEGGRLNSAWFGPNADLKKKVFTAAIDKAYKVAA